jgi:hypothetical protein
MTRGVQASLIVLSAAVVVLTIGLVMALTLDNDTAHMNARSNNYMRMMDAMGRMDSDDMLSQMQSILGPEGYQTMLSHMAEHRAGMMTSTGDSIDGMMHMMMDGMMNQMPLNRNMMPMGPR